MKMNPRQYDLRDFDEDEDELPRMSKKPTKPKKQKMRDEFTKRDNKKFNKPNKNSHKYD